MKVCEQYRLKLKYPTSLIDEKSSIFILNECFIGFLTRLSIYGRKWFIIGLSFSSTIIESHLPAAGNVRLIGEE
jgi:hypothetical protein